MRWFIDTTIEFGAHFSLHVNLLFFLVNQSLEVGVGVFNGSLTICNWTTLGNLLFFFLFFFINMNKPWGKWLNHPIRNGDSNSIISHFSIDMNTLGRCW